MLYYVTLYYILLYCIILYIIFTFWLEFNYFILISWPLMKSLIPVSLT